MLWSVNSEHGSHELDLPPGPAPPGDLLIPRGNGSKFQYLIMIFAGCIHADIPSASKKKKKKICSYFLFLDLFILLVP